VPGAVAGLALILIVVATSLAAIAVLNAVGGGRSGASPTAGVTDPPGVSEAQEWMDIWMARAENTGLVRRCFRWAREDQPNYNPYEYGHALAAIHCDFDRTPAEDLVESLFLVEFASNADTDSYFFYRREALDPSPGPCPGTDGRWSFRRYRVACHSNADRRRVLVWTDPTRSHMGVLVSPDYGEDGQPDIARLYAWWVNAGFPVGAKESTDESPPVSEPPVSEPPVSEPPVSEPPAS
jgi:hypothetical protein